MRLVTAYAIEGVKESVVRHRYSRHYCDRSIDPWTESFLDIIADQSYCKHLHELVDILEAVEEFLGDSELSSVAVAERTRGTSGGLENRTVMSVGNTRRRRRREQDARFSFLRDAVVLRDLDCCVL